MSLLIVVEIEPPEKALKLLNTEAQLFQAILDDNPLEINQAVVKYSILKNKAKLVTVTRNMEIVALILLQPVVYPTGYKILQVSSVSGEYMEEWLDSLITLLNKFALEENCVEIRTVTKRKGWIKILEKYNWKPLYEIITYLVPQGE